MAAPSTYQDPETRKVSFYVNNRTWKILEKMAERRGMETWKFIREHVEHLALAGTEPVSDREGTIMDLTLLLLLMLVSLWVAARQ